MYNKRNLGYATHKLYNAHQYKKAEQVMNKILGENEP
jgi:hypothetical protein